MCDPPWARFRFQYAFRIHGISSAGLIDPVWGLTHGNIVTVAHTASLMVLQFFFYPYVDVVRPIKAVMPRTINFTGSVALLVSSITGPSLVVIPLLFQQAGWLTPLLTFAAMALLSVIAALLLVEAMSSIEGNEEFQASIEFTTIAHLFLGKRWHVVVQCLLYLAMQTLVIASLLESFQSMDTFLISVAHKTCAISFMKGWVCVNQIPPNGSSPFSGYILGSFGTLITMSLVLPLSLVHLVDNIIFQVVSFIVLLIITVLWITIFAIRGLHTNPIPVVGSDQSTVAGFVLSNFSFVTTIPAWVNNTHPSVNIRLAVWTSVLISCLIYVPIGWMGGSAFVFPNSATLLQVIVTDKGHSSLGTVAQVSSYMFPLAVLITSVPVFTIVIRYNLLRGNICSNGSAIFWSAIFPWLIAVPFQTNGGLETILNWASLIFTSPSNLLVPFVLFIVSKRHTASAILDANFSLEVLPVSNSGVPLTPVEPTAMFERTATQSETVPVVIITDSTDMDPNSTDEAETLVSRESTEASTKPIRPDAIPMPVSNRVSAPSRHRYYGQVVVSEAGEPPAIVADRPVLRDVAAHKAKAPAEAQKQQRSSFAISISRSHSLTHSSDTGMDEFLLMGSASPESPCVRTVIGSRNSSPQPPHSPDTMCPSAPSTSAERYPPTGCGSGDIRISMSSPTVVAEEPLPKFKALPCLTDTSPIRSTHISTIGCLLASSLVLTAIVYDIIQSVRGESGG